MHFGLLKLRFISNLSIFSSDFLKDFDQKPIMRKSAFRSNYQILHKPKLLSLEDGQSLIHNLIFTNLSLVEYYSSD